MTAIQQRSGQRHQALSDALDSDIDSDSDSKSGSVAAPPASPAGTTDPTGTTGPTGSTGTTGATSSTRATGTTGTTGASGTAGIQGPAEAEPLASADGPSTAAATGPLNGLRILEFAGIGPGPVAGLMLADYGANVTVVVRPGDEPRLGGGLALNRGKAVVALDLKTEAGRQRALALMAEADAVIEPFRPGVMERLGLGPDDICATHPRLVYVRLTGWGQTGPLAPRAGHDLNYVALTGLLDIAARPGQPPAIPATLVGDIAGGALTMLVGLMSALWEAQRSGRGQVIDAAMVDGVCYMGTLVQALRSAHLWPAADSENFFRHSAHFYDCFACADGRYLSVGAIEGQFHAAFIRGLGLPPDTPQHQPALWPQLRAEVQTRLQTQPRDHWLAVFEGTDACVAPVLSLDEAPLHPHHQARGNHVRTEEGWWPSPAPRFSRTPARRRPDDSSR